MATCPTCAKANCGNWSACARKAEAERVRRAGAIARSERELLAWYRANQEWAEGWLMCAICIGDIEPMMPEIFAGAERRLAAAGKGPLSDEDREFMRVEAARLWYEKKTKENEERRIKQFNDAFRTLMFEPQLGSELWKTMRRARDALHPTRRQDTGFVAGGPRRPKGPRFR